MNLKIGKVLKTMAALVFITLTSHTKSSAQCHYVTVSPEMQSSLVIIPADFPVINYEMATDEQKVKFESEVKVWKETAGVAANLLFYSKNNIDFINIPKADFDTFDEKRKEIILSYPSFYHIN